MSKKNLKDEKVEEDDDEEDDDDYCPIKNDNEQSDASDESEHDDDDVNEVPGNEELENNKQNDLNVTPYDESKTNELWKSFTNNTKASSSLTTKDSPKVATDSQKATTSKIFEFAGEKVAVPVTTTTTAPIENLPLKRPASSNSVLDRLGIGKKQKLSTLEKSRLDWSVHKQSESLVEDLDSHRRGKDSYVEKKAFLQRSEEREHDHFLNIVKKK